MLAAVAAAGYREPTPIQRQAIPVALAGRDLLGSAQTGTGKTAAFVLPLVDVLAGGPRRARMPRALILSPTRELAQQTLENFRIYAGTSDLAACLLIGGGKMKQQVEALAGDIDVLIATPGRMLDMVERGRLLMAGVKHLVIDEADRMLDMGFIPDVERICSLLPPRRQTLMFSATMPPPIRRLAERFLRDPQEVQAAPPASPAETVEQWLLSVADERAKARALTRMLAWKAVTSAMVFSNRKRDVDSLYRTLKAAGFAAVRMQGDMAQPEREEALEAFRSGAARVLVCTDVAGRGIDVFGVSHVFCFDVPVNAEDYVHRIGRTGRAGHRGRACMFATPEDARALQAVTRLIGRTLPQADPSSWGGTPAPEAEQGPPAQAAAAPARPPRRRRRANGASRAANGKEPTAARPRAADERESARPPAADERESAARPRAADERESTARPRAADERESARPRAADGKEPTAARPRAADERESARPRAADERESTARPRAADERESARPRAADEKELAARHNGASPRGGRNHRAAAEEPARPRAAAESEAILAEPGGPRAARRPRRPQAAPPSAPFGGHVPAFLLRPAPAAEEAG